MSVHFRHYTNPNDYKLVDKFLIDNHQTGNTDGNWLEPIWEYMHHHPALDDSAIEKIGIWEDEGKIVAVAHYEWHVGEAFFQFHPAYKYLRQEMLDYAEENLTGQSNKDGRKYLSAYINDIDEEFTSLVQSRGYKEDEKSDRPMYQFVIPTPFPSITLPEGFHLTSLAEDCDWGKVNRVLWRGFNHEGEPPAGEDELESRRKMFDTPSARRDLKIAVRTARGDFVSFCGIFYEAPHCFAYVEPVATDPDFRRLGLGKAAVLEGIRRSSELGATMAYVGSDQAFYQAIGFRKVFNSACWIKYF